MAIVLGTIHNTSIAVNTDLFSSPFVYTAPINVRPAPMLKLIIQIAPGTAAANLRALVSDGSTTETIILGTMTDAQQLYTYSMLWRAGDSIDFQYNGIAGPMDLNVKVLQSDDIMSYSAGGAVA